MAVELADVEGCCPLHHLLAKTDAGLAQVLLLAAASKRLMGVGDGVKVDAVGRPNGLKGKNPLQVALTGLTNPNPAGRWPTAAIPMENSYCSCKLTRTQPDPRQISRRPPPPSRPAWPTLASAARTPASTGNR